MDGTRAVTVTTQGLAGSRRGLELRPDLQTYATTFAWGPGAAHRDGGLQLAVALLADAFSDPVAQQLHTTFYEMAPAGFDAQHPWELPLSVVAKAALLCWLDQCDAQQLLEIADYHLRR